MIAGDVLTFLGALGSREGEPLLEKALALVGGEYEVELFDEGEVEEKYLVMPGRGVDFLLKDGVLTTVFVYASDTDDQRAYGGWQSLVPGVEADSSRDDVVAALGDPVAETASFIRYRLDTGFVQFDYDGGNLSMLVVMGEVIGDGARDSGDTALPEVESIEGEIMVFMRAVGQPMFSPEHFAVIGLVGPATASYDDSRDGVEWQYEESARAGVLLQFKQEVLVGALIHLIEEDDQASYPTSAQLIAGLSLPAGRESIRSHFGAPRHEDETVDLYFVDERYLRFDFVEGESAALTVILPGITP